MIPDPLPEAPYIEFAEYLKRLIDSRSLRQSDLARQLGVSPSQVSAWLTGRRRPEPENLERLAGTHALDLDKLMRMARYFTGKAPEPRHSLSEDESDWLTIYREMAEEDRARAKAIARAYLGHSNVTWKRFGRSKTEQRRFAEVRRLGTALARPASTLTAGEKYLERIYGTPDPT
jgi:transcriptional regulator with XRE-family HTH domain